METLKFNYVLSEKQNKELYGLLSTLQYDPYVNVEKFKAEISELIDSDSIPNWFVAICEDWKTKDKFEFPEFLLKNVPIDKKIPVLDYDNPVIAKYRLKRTNISESFLELFSQLCSQESIGYRFVNTGDIYQDIHPMKSLSNSQSQKAIVNLGFHKDLANHFVRPDYVNIVCLRNDNTNQVYTTFVRNKDLIDHLSKLGIIELLKEEMYFTPFDDLTKYGDAMDSIGEAKNHRIIYDDINIAFFEGRTIGTTEEHQQAVNEVVKALHLLKRGLHFQNGEFISSENNSCIHGKEIVLNENPEKLKERWLMKTVNVNDIRKHEKYLMEGKKFIING